jgi:hypothetical protein
MIHFVMSDLPEFKQSMKDAMVEVRAFRGEMASIDNRQRTELLQHVSQEQASREKINNSLQAIRANIIVLREKVDKRALRPEEIGQILSSAHSIGLAEGSVFGAFTSVSGEAIPRTPAGIKSVVKAGYVTSDLAEVLAAEKGITLTAGNLSKYLVRALVAKGAMWEATANGIKFTHAFGSGIYTYKKQVGPEEIKRQVDLFNAVSNVGRISNDWQITPQP